jgi:hypothetical protein
MRSILLAVFVLATGCVGTLNQNPPGDDDDDPGPTEEARTLYIENVHPIMARCSGGTCHSTDATASAAIGKFYTADASAGYTGITSAISIVGTYTEIAPVLTKIDAGHQGIVYSGAERTAILDWLAAEFEERKDDTGPPPVDPVALLKTFSSCMTIENFNQAQMAQLFGGMAALNGQACTNCHQSGGFGFTVSNQADIYFQLISTSMSQHLKYFSVLNGKVVLNGGALANAGTVIPDHPPFDPVNNQGQPALEEFYMLTDAATLAAGAAGCGPAKIVDP